MNGDERQGLARESRENSELLDDVNRRFWVRSAKPGVELCQATLVGDDGGRK